MADPAPGRFDADRVSRLVILLSASCAVGWDALFGSWSHLGRGLAEPIALATAFLATLIHPAAGYALVLLAACTLPAVLNALTGLFDFAASGVWVAALLGVILASGRFRGWSLPATWRLPLALGGLCLAASWPIIVGREVDFWLPQLFERRPAVANWVAHIASVQLIGILWVDALFARYGRERVERFEREIVWPLAGGALISVMVGLYQMSVDSSLLNPTVYGQMGRAAGLMQDGNVFGTISAMWIAALAALALHAGRAGRWLAFVAAPAALAVVWGSGSRTALLAAACGTLAAAYGVGATLTSTRARIAATASAALVAAAVVVFVASSSATSGPIGRIKLALDRSWAADQPLIQYLWERGGHGLAAIRMIREYPAFGVGVGTFHTLVGDFSRAVDPSLGVGPDNAQNWFRHQLAELGVVGSLGWMVFAGILTLALLASARGEHRVRAVVVAGAIAGLGLASLLGVPTQHVVVLVTFWTFVFWHHALRRPAPSPERAWSPGRWQWTAVALLAVAFTAGTFQVARGDLRVPRRGVRFGWPYEQGFHPRPDPAVQPFRRTRRHAVAVFKAEERYLKLVFQAEHPDVTAEPVQVRIWRSGERIANVTLSSPTPVTWYIRAPDAEWMMLETAVSRTWPLRPADGGQQTEVGLTLADWEFVHDAPRRTVVVD